MATRNTKSSSTKKSGAATAKPYDEHTKLHELFVEELKDIFWAEKHLLKALPKMAKAATSTELSTAFLEHAEQTENQVARLEEVFGLLGMASRAKKCEAMEGLVRETMSAIEDTDKGTSTRDAALIISAQKSEHYEIASYGSLVQLAKTMNLEDIADILHETLEEEKETDERLTALAVSSININAEHEEE
jgi:ferritin-like metal-binding protein YciE